MSEERMACSSILWSLLAVTCLAACGGATADDDGGTEPGEPCVGQYEGSYSGGSRGDLDGKLSESGAFDLTFSPEGLGASFSGSGQLNDNGTISFDAGLLVVTGRLNEAQCRATGRWDTGEAEGSWTATRR